MGPVHQFHDFPHGAPGNDIVFSPVFQGLDGYAPGKGNFPFNLGVGFFKLGIEFFGDFSGAFAFHFDADGFGDIFQLDGVFDFVIMDFTIDHASEQIQNAHAVIRMRCRSGGYHAGEIPCLDCVDVCTANPDLSVRIFGVQSAWTHCTVLAAGRIRTYGAGFHICGAVKGRFNAVSLGFSKHLGCSFTDGHITGVNMLQGIRFFGFHFVLPS